MQQIRFFGINPLRCIISFSRGSYYTRIQNITQNNQNNTPYYNINTWSINNYINIIYIYSYPAHLNTNSDISSKLQEVSKQENKPFFDT